MTPGRGAALAAAVGVLVALVGLIGRAPPDPTPFEPHPPPRRLEPEAWPAGGAAALAHRGYPALIRHGSPAHDWAAAWSGIAQRADGVVLRQVWHSDQPQLVYSSAHGELGGETAMRALPAHTLATRTRVAARPLTLGQLLRDAPNVARARNGTVLYWQDDLAALGPEAAASVDIEPLAIREVDNAEVATLAWIGSAGAQTSAHYDIEHNLFAQVYGMKAFYIWPPSAHASLRVFPTRHSLHRQSSLRGLPESAHPPIYATLSAGDVLYIPPYWPHHVIARSRLSVSVSVWSTSASGVKYAELERLPLPWEAEWSHERVTVAATQARSRPYLTPIRSVILNIRSA